jgi:hypothetical protein
VALGQAVDRVGQQRRGRVGRVIAAAVPRGPGRGVAQAEVGRQIECDHAARAQRGHHRRRLAVGQRANATSAPAAIASASKPTIGSVEAAGQVREHRGQGLAGGAARGTPASIATRGCPSKRRSSSAPV